MLRKSEAVVEIISQIFLPLGLLGSESCEVGWWTAQSKASFAVSPLLQKCYVKCWNTRCNVDLAKCTALCHLHRNGYYGSFWDVILFMWRNNNKGRRWEKDNVQSLSGCDVFGSYQQHRTTYKTSNNELNAGKSFMCFLGRAERLNISHHPPVSNSRRDGRLRFTSRGVYLFVLSNKWSWELNSGGQRPEIT